MSLQPGAFEALTAFMAERHAVYMRKAYLTETPAGGMSSKMRAAWDPNRRRVNKPIDWTLNDLTDDPILAKFRFCNVYRELDKVTVWIRENIREPFADDPHLWFMLAIARHINWPDTLKELIDADRTWPGSRGFMPEYMTNQLLWRQNRGDKIYTGAYMIRAEQHDHPWRYWPKVRYSAEIVLGKLWEERDILSRAFSVEGQTMENSWSFFQPSKFVGWGPFMAYQVVVDMRWTRYLRNAPDIQTWAAVGPGSARGLNRLHGREVKANLRQEQALEEMLELRELMAKPGALAPWLDLPDLSDVQNILCEYDKYERVRLGEGRPRALYIPGRGG